MRRRFINSKEKYLSILALEDTTITVRAVGAGELFAQINNGVWESLINVPVELSAGDVIKYKGSIRETATSTTSQRGVMFSISNKVELFGDCTSIFKKRKLISYAFYEAFANAPIIRVSADFLPATTLASYCYYGMFYNCTSLTTAPVLPATTLAYNCYKSMFRGCTSLTTAPELPATTLANSCYSDMFYGCTSLVNAPELPATTLATNCYSDMFLDCKSLTTAPELPATTLASYCYYGMFYNCTKLNYIKMLATDISAGGCLNNWVYNVASSGTFVKNPAMTSLPTATSYNNYKGIPSGWTVVNDGEEDGGEVIS